MMAGAGRKPVIFKKKIENAKNARKSFGFPGVFTMEAARIELASENRFTRPSPSADGYLHSLMQT